MDAIQALSLTILLLLCSLESLTLELTRGTDVTLFAVEDTLASLTHLYLAVPQRYDLDGDAPFHFAFM